MAESQWLDQGVEAVPSRVTTPGVPSKWKEWGWGLSALLREGRRGRKPPTLKTRGRHQEYLPSGEAGKEIAEASFPEEWEQGHSH